MAAVGWMSSRYARARVCVLIVCTHRLICFVPQGDVYTNTQGTYLADLALDAGELTVYASESRQAPLQPARGLGPVIRMKILPPPPPATMMDYPWRLNVTVQTNLTAAPVTTTIQHPLAGVVPRITYLGRMISSGTWSYDGTEFFLVWMDGLISKAVVHPQVRAGVCAWCCMHAMALV